MTSCITTIFMVLLTSGFSYIFIYMLNFMFFFFLLFVVCDVKTTEQIV